MSKVVLIGGPLDGRRVEEPSGTELRVVVPDLGTAQRMYHDSLVEDAPWKWRPIPAEVYTARLLRADGREVFVWAHESVSTFDAFLALLAGYRGREA